MEWSPVYSDIQGFTRLPETTASLGESIVTTVMPQGELIRRAAQYIDELLKEGKALGPLLDEAGMRYNLSPKDAEMLRDLFKPAKTEE